MTQPVRPAPFCRLDAVFLAAALAAAIGVSFIDPWSIEDPLGLTSTMSHRDANRSDLEATHTAEANAAEAGFERWLVEVGHALRQILSACTPILVLLAPGVGLATFRGRSMHRRRCLRGVGVLTTAIAATMVVESLPNEYLFHGFPGILRGYGNPPAGIWREIADQVSVAILASWIVLAIGRRWHEEPHWRDRLGRALGGAWIAYWFLDGIVSPLWLQY